VNEFRCHITSSNYYALQRGCNGLIETNYPSQVVAPSNFYAPWSGLRDGSTLSITNYHNFRSFLLQRMNAKTAGDRLRYAKQYASVLTSSEISDNLQCMRAVKRSGQSSQPLFHHRLPYLQPLHRGTE
jgi:hypothetical protein